jgi:hypothetical protein
MNGLCKKITNVLSGAGIHLLVKKKLNEDTSNQNTKSHWLLVPG